MASQGLPVCSPKLVCSCVACLLSVKGAKCPLAEARGERLATLWRLVCAQTYVRAVVRFAADSPAVPTSSQGAPRALAGPLGTRARVTGAGLSDRSSRMSPLRFEKSEDTSQSWGIFSAVIQGREKEVEREVEAGQPDRHSYLEKMNCTTVGRFCLRLG